jgi:hypothetical protein
MQNITITRTKNTVSATYLPYAAYKSAIALATAHKGEIGKTAEGNFQATFKSVKIAKQFESEWTADYNANRKVEPTVAPTQKPKASKVWDAKYFVELAVANGDTYEDAIAEACRITAELRNAQKSTTSKPTAKKSETKATTSSRKQKATPRKAKGNGIDFTKFQGTKSDKNRALHAQLVSMGIADSRTPEYMSIWNARPWAK